MKGSKIVALAVTAICASVFCAFGCAETNDNQTSNDTYRIYDAYLLNEASAGNDSPLSYEDWLSSIKGERGADGKNGKDGKDGVNGTNGESAYEIWLAAGNEGTEEDFIASLKGEKGESGADGVNGTDGKDGVDGTDGKSAYEIWLAAGNVGTEEDFILALKGSKGDKGDVGQSGAKGDKGDKGEKGEDGSDGVSVVNAYVNDRKHLILQLSNGVQIDAGYVGVEVEVPVESKVYSVIFMADGIMVGMVEYGEGDVSVTEPSVPEKSGHVGTWESYTLSNKNIVVNAVYTEITEQPSPSDPTQINPTDFESEEEYVIKVASVGGLALSGIKISAVHDTGVVLASGTTDSTGTVKFGLIDGEYVIKADASTLPSGYYLTDTEYKTDGEKRSVINFAVDSKVFEETLEDDFTYSVGDIARDFTVKQYNTGSEFTLSQILESKTAVVLIFFDPTGATSKQQMDIFESVYQQNYGNVQVLGVYSSDKESSVSAFLDDYYSNNDAEMTIPLVKDTENLFGYFNVGQCPTTVVIDRYGMIAEESTVVTTINAATALINKYIAKSYKQTI